MSTPTNKSAKQSKKATAASTAEATVLIKTLKQNGKKKPNVFANVEVVGTGVRTPFNGDAPAAGSNTIRNPPRGAILCYSVGISGLQAGEDVKHKELAQALREDAQRR
jgi:hypothetical protein